MPDIAALHPQVVHFVVGSLMLGLPLYWLSFIRRLRFLRPAASVLLLVGTAASFLAVRSGIDAHGPAERIPGVRALVEEHEELGITARNFFAVILLLEMIALAVAWRVRHAGHSVLAVEAGETHAAGASTLRFAATTLSLVVAIAWTLAALQLYETAEHGGELVYEHAGGIGFRSGDTADVGRLLLAGLYAQSRVDREAGRMEDAARLVEEMVQRHPDDPEIQILGAESLVLDRRDGRAALERLAILPAPGDARLELRRQVVAFDAYLLLGLPDSARIALEAVPEQYRESRTVTDRMAQLR